MSDSQFFEPAPFAERAAYGARCLRLRARGLRRGIGWRIAYRNFRPGRFVRSSRLGRRRRCRRRRNGNFGRGGRGYIGRNWSRSSSSQGDIRFHTAVTYWHPMTRPIPSQAQARCDARERQWKLTSWRHYERCAAARAASGSGTPRFAYPAAICSAFRSCLSVNSDFSPPGMGILRRGSAKNALGSERFPSVAQKFANLSASPVHRTAGDAE